MAEQLVSVENFSKVTVTHVQLYINIYAGKKKFTLK